MAQEKSKTPTVVYAQEIPYYTHITTQRGKNDCENILTQGRGFSILPP